MKRFPCKPILRRPAACIFAIDVVMLVSAADELGHLVGKLWRSRGVQVHAAAAFRATACAGRIDEMVLLDRETDVLTALCTQLTYEGLLDEVLHIKNGTTTLDPGGATL